MSNDCPFCGSNMKGEKGKQVCSNMSCRAYEVDVTDRKSYDRHLSKKEYDERRRT